MTWVAVGLAIYAALCALVYFAQRSLIYYPTPERHGAPAEVLRLASGGASLKIWHRPQSSERAIVYFGGNAEDVAWNIEELASSFPGTALYLANYRGYGGSSGSPSEAALLVDAQVLFDHVHARHPRVAVMGRSLGSGVAVHLASVRDVWRLVLVTPFDSVENVAKRQLPILPVGLLLQDRYDSLSRVPRVSAPTLVLVAANDQVIPRANTDRLIAAFPPGRVEVAVIAGATHDTIDARPGYREALETFLGR